MNINVPTAESKIRHAKVLKQLAAILRNNPPQRVDTSAPQRVEQKASPLNSPTSPRVIEGTKVVHQKVTRSDIPMPSIMEVNEPPRDQQVATQRSKRNSNERLLILPSFDLPKRMTKSRKVNGILIGASATTSKMHQEDGSKRLLKCRM